MIGRIIEFIEDGKLFCAICLEEKSGRLHLLTSRNREINLSHRRILHASSKSYSVDTGKEGLLSLLKEAEELRERLKSGINVKELWETVNDLDEIGFKDLAELVFGYNIGDEHISAVVRALFEDRVYFRLRENAFSPVPPHKVEEYFERLEEERRKKERVALFARGLKALFLGEEVEEDLKGEIVKYLKDLVLFGKEAEEYEFIKEIFGELGEPDPKRARELLNGLGIWRDDEDLELLRSGLQLEFPQEVAKEATRLRRHRPQLNGREDLRNLPVFTVDGPKTRDFDDALSLEIRPNIFRLGIHISDVASIIRPESPLDSVLMERASSLYLPTKYLPMIPPELSEDGLSLIEGLERPAVSLFVDFDREFGILSFRFTPSMIKVEKQLTYDQVDQALEYEEAFEILYSLANHLRKKRLEEGGLDLTLPEVVLAYRPDGRLELFWVDLGSPSRRIVQEAMILYNQLAAAYLVQGGIPALYRVQEGPMERLSETEMDRILYVFLQRRRLLPLTIGTEPGPHVPLGVSSYVQITSPIRRFLDLIVQRQISASLMGDRPPYDQKALENIKARIEPILKEQEKVRRASMTHWLLRYFHQNQGKTFHGLVLDDLKTRFRIIIKEALFVVEAKKDLFKGNINQGDELLIRIKKVDPWTGQLEIAGV